MKIQVSLTFLVLAYTGCPRKEAVKRVSNKAIVDIRLRPPVLPLVSH